MEISKQKQLGILAGLSLPLLLAALLLFWRAGEPSAAIRIDTAEISARYTDSLRIGVDQDLPPYAYVDSNGTIKGFLVDLARSLALEYGLDVELYSRGQADMIQALAAGDLDLVVSNTDEPGAYLSSDVLIESEDAIFVRGDNSYISTLEDLRNLAVAINTASLTSAVNSYINENNQDSLKIVMNQEHEMCIRDRQKAAGQNAGEYVPRARIMGRNIYAGPVSYTHLDVYKRQSPDAWL